MTTGTSLMLIAIGAVLAFAVSFQVVGMNIANIGAILMVVGMIGLFISLATIAGYAPWSTATSTAPLNQASVASPAVPQAAVQPTAAAPQASVVVVNAPGAGSTPAPSAPAPTSQAAAPPPELPAR